jgi:hypothetical protein
MPADLGRGFAGQRGLTGGPLTDDRHVEMSPTPAAGGDPASEPARAAARPSET